MEKRIYPPHIQKQKGQEEPLICLTAYTAHTAHYVDPHCDVVLVGDSVAMVVYGMESTLGADLDMMARHGKAVVGATNKACVVVDMPFGSYQESPEQAFRNAAYLMKETGAQAVKMEGGTELAATVNFLVRRGIPVMGHIGLLPQSVNTLGGYESRGKDSDEAKSIQHDAQSLEEAGVFAIVLEGTLEAVARRITAEVSVPVIGIGASPACDGQILVTEDMLGITPGHVPKFVKQYASLGTEMDAAINRYSQEVRARVFPSEKHVYTASKKPTVV